MLYIYNNISHVHTTNLYMASMCLAYLIILHIHCICITLHYLNKHTTYVIQYMIMMYSKYMPNRHLYNIIFSQFVFKTNIYIYKHKEIPVGYPNGELPLGKPMKKHGNSRRPVLRSCSCCDSFASFADWTPQNLAQQSGPAVFRQEILLRVFQLTSLWQLCTWFSPHL